MLKILVNNLIVETEINPATTTLEFLRDELRLKGTKEGCGEGECGACTVLVGAINKDGIIEYRSSSSCLLTVGELNSKHLVTIEGVSEDKLHKVQNAIISNSASQCGFCTPGIVMSLIGFFLSAPKINIAEAMTNLDGNICRCTGYESIKNGIKELLGTISFTEFTKENRLEKLIQQDILPDWFKDVPEKLSSMATSDEVRYYFDLEKSVVIAGGTDLVVQKKDQLLDKHLVFLSQMYEFGYLIENDSTIRVGSTCTAEEIRNSPILCKYFPSLRNDLMVMSSKMLRNNGTLAGNIVNASPIGDLSIIFLGLYSTITLKNGDSERVVPIEKFFKGYKKLDMQPGEIIKEIGVKKPSKNSRFSFEKISNRKILDIATCNTAMSIETENNQIIALRISAGGIGAIPMLLTKTSEFLIGKEVNNRNVKQASEIVLSEVTPRSDIHGSEAYKKLLLKHLILAHFIKLFPQHIQFEEVI